MRFSPTIHDLPHLDEIMKMPALEEEVLEYMETDSIYRDIQQTMRALYASSFYFDKRYTPALEDCVTGWLNEFFILFPLSLIAYRDDSVSVRGRLTVM
jgi:hypothetical protein